MMTRYVALLRAVNVGGHGKVAMSDLRDLLGELGFAEARSLLQTGNLIFLGESKTGLECELLLEREAARRLNLRTDFLVRTAEEWAAVVDGNPFPEVARSDPGHLVVVFLKQAPDKESVDALRAAVKGREEVSVEGCQAYISYPDGIGRSRLTSTLIEAKLGTRGTGRNWNTILKIATLVRA
jgi:uncharacterized protein (DUF1697 family)